MAWDGGREIWVGGVNTWECDEMGHLNVRHWVAKSLEALAGLAGELGMGDAFSPRAEATLLVREQHVRFLKEAHPGAALSARGGVLAIEADEARLLTVIQHPDGAPGATFQTVVRHATADGARIFPWPRRVMERAKDLMVDLPDFAAARTINLSPIAASAGSLASAEEMGLKRIGLGVVGAPDVDGFGRMRPEILMGKISDGILHLLGPDRGIGAEGQRVGGAALEYRLVHYGWPRLGDRFELRSATAHVEERYRLLRHWMLDPETGRPWAAAENVAVGFDLDARKVVRLPPDAVARIQATARPEMQL